METLESNLIDIEDGDLQVKDSDGRETFPFICC